jgi:UDP-N-acetylmuramoyl-L-alanyl-D-glutamate--2,6-diaminopimelate ligase
MLLSELAQGLPGLIGLIGDAEISDISIDSRKVRDGSLFVAIKGERSDGHAYIESAIASGAAGAVLSNEMPCSVPTIRVKNTVDALWRVSKKFYGDPSSELTMVGITGTNGKTTTAWITTQALIALGVNAAYVGTLGAIHQNETIDIGFTTPFPPETFSLLKNLKARGAQAAVMEVSSHALSQRRIDGIEFDVAAFTNLSQDHLDLHGDMESYFQAKRRLFCDLETNKQLKGVSNADDDYGRRLIEEGLAKVSFGTTSGRIRIVDRNVWMDRLTMTVTIDEVKTQLQVPIGGGFNVMNVAASIAILYSLGYSARDIGHSLSAVRAAPGRFESVPTRGDYQVIVDYAHTDDALSKLLRSVRELGPNRIITVFGCGGDRDSSKRPKMGLAATSLSDIAIVTSDNPRTEDPNKIISDILVGATGGAEVHVEPDRKAAINAAIAEAREGDVVVIAGKGHEDYQILSTGKIHFDDREIAAEAIAKRAVCA